MARKQRNEIQAGLLTLLAVAVLLGVVLWMGGADWFSRSGQTVVFYAPAATGPLGLEPGAMVKVNDAEVGKLVEIRYDRAAGRTYYVAQISAGDLAVFADAQAEVVAPFIGNPVISLRSTGSESAARAESEDQAVRIGAGGFMGSLQAASDSISRELDPGSPDSVLVQIKGIVRQLNTAAGNVNAISEMVIAQLDAKQADSLMAGLHQSLADVNILTASVRDQADADVDGSLLAKILSAAEMLNEMMARLSRETDPAVKATLMAKIHATVDDINAMTADARPRIKNILTAAGNTAEMIEGYTREDLGAVMKDLRKISDRALQIAEDFRTVSRQAKEIVETNRTNIDELLDNMTQLSANLKATGQEVRRSPWKLLYRPDDEERRSQDIYDAARSFAAGAEQLDQAIGKLKKLKQLYPEGTPEDHEGYKKIQEHLEEVFRKFHKAEQALWQELSK
ncbi:MAG: hypothetical protein ACLFUJ_14950 [Phycisphaerae bacterium]